MPLFLFCSGLFVARQYQKGSWEGVIANALTFYVLYIFFYGAKYLISIACGSNPTFNPLYMNAGSWYLFVLASFLLLSPALSKLKMGWALVLSLVLSVVSCLFNDDRTFLSSSRFFTYLPWFVAGFYLSGDRLNEWKSRYCSSKLPTRAVCIALSLFVLFGYLVALYLVLSPELVTLNRQLSTGLHSIDDIKWVFGSKGLLFVITLGFCRIAHYGLVAIICLSVMVLVPVKSGLLSAWGRSSLQVYILHLLLLYTVDGICGLDYFAEHLGLLGDWWAVAFPIVAGLITTALLAIPKSPNNMVLFLKRTIRNKALSL